MLISVVAADGRLVAVQHGVFQVFHVQADAVAHDEHQEHGAQAGHRHADRVAGQLHQLAVAASQHPLEAEPGAGAGRAVVGLRGRTRLGRRGLRRRRRLGGLLFRLRLFQVADERIFQRRRVPPLDHPVRRVDDQHLSGAHQRDAVAAPGLVDEVGGDEDGDLVAAGQLDQVLPEAVPGHRVHPRGRLVEDQQVGPVDQRHGQLQALPLSQRERVGQRLHDLIEAEPRGRLFDAPRDLGLGHVKELGVQDQVLPHRQLGVEREGLRHVADLAADGDVVGIDRLAEQPGLPLGGRQQAAQHLHRRRLAAAVGAEEAVDLPPLDPEVDVIDRRETAEPLGQVVRLDDHLLLARRARGDHQLLVAAGASPPARGR